MSSENLLLAILAISFSAILAMEFVLMKKGNFKILTIILTALGSIITFLIKGDILTTPSEKLIFFSIFLPSFVIIVYLIYHCSYKKVIKSQLNINTQRFSNFISFLELGNHQFVEAIKNNEKEYEQSEYLLMKKEFDSLKEFTDSMSNELIELYYSIINLMIYEEKKEKTRDDALERILGYACFSFLPIVSAMTDSRLTVRKFDPDLNAMKNMVSTNTPDKAPSPIYLKKGKNNMIVRSMIAKCPIFYSANKTYHQQTIVNSLGLGKYDDYISFCLISVGEGKNLRPKYSICLEYKNIYSEKMKSLVYSQSFSLFCKLLIECINRLDKTEENYYGNI